MTVFLWHQKGYAAALPGPPAYADHMTGMGSKPLQSSKNDATVLTWGKTGLAASTPWLKFSEIGVPR